jgi:restriction system protein
MPNLLRSLAWEIFWIFVAFAILKAGVPFLIEYFRKQRLIKYGIGDIDQMDGKTFEQYLEALFERMGYHVERTRYVGDYGADLITRKNGVKTVVQAKRYKRSVGLKAVQEAVAAKGMYGCTEAMVVTNSTFTRQAIELARANRVTLWNRERLIEALLSVSKDGQPLTAQQKTATVEPLGSMPDDGLASADNNAVCEMCGKRVSADVQRYCLSHPTTFSGRIYCYTHQKDVKVSHATGANK